MSPEPPQASDVQIEKLTTIIKDANATVAERYRALFTLTALSGTAITERLCECLLQTGADDSELVRHELAYIIGQRQDNAAVPHLYAVLCADGFGEGRTRDVPIVRHEAGEALAAIGTEEALAALRRARDSFQPDDDAAVRETVELALDRVALGEPVKPSSFGSVDPAPALPTGTVASWTATLGDTSLPLFDRYRAMFSLRDKKSLAAINALADALLTDTSSALFRHEVAFVLGQLGHRAACAALLRGALAEEEHPMVRHECVEALGACADAKLDAAVLEAVAALEEGSVVPTVVRESALVAADVAKYNDSAEFQYADGLTKAE